MNVCCPLHVMSSEEGGVTRAGDGQLLFGELLGCHKPAKHPHTHCFVWDFAPKDRNHHHWLSWACRDVSSKEGPIVRSPRANPPLLPGPQGRIHKANLSAFHKSSGLGSTQPGACWVTGVLFSTPLLQGWVLHFPYHLSYTNTNLCCCNHHPPEFPLPNEYCSCLPHCYIHPLLNPSCY